MIKQHFNWCNGLGHCSTPDEKQNLIVYEGSDESKRELEELMEELPLIGGGVPLKVKFDGKNCFSKKIVTIETRDKSPLSSTVCALKKMGTEIFIPQLGFWFMIFRIV